MTRQYDARWIRWRLMWPMMTWMILCLALTGSSEAWGQVRVASDGNIVMTSADLRGLLVAAETARAEADALRRSLEEERALSRGYEAKTQALVAALGAERTSWQDLEDALNAELRDARRQRMSWGITGFGVGVLAGLMIQ